MAPLLHPQEIEVYYILPALRREISITLKSQGIAQKRIAGLLGVTAAAVSQYLKKKRASEVRFNEQMLKEISRAVQDITDTSRMMAKIQHLLNLARETGITCALHHKLTQLPRGCDACAKPVDLIAIGGINK